MGKRIYYSIMMSGQLVEHLEKVLFPQSLTWEVFIADGLFEEAHSLQASKEAGKWTVVFGIFTGQ